MAGHIILSHGSDSGPGATKVSALAGVAETLGWSTERPDYGDCDALGFAGSVTPRIERLVGHMRASATPPVLVGSSMGAFVSGLASLEAPCAGLFLLALPTGIPDYLVTFDMARDVPSMLIHGFEDDVCPMDAALSFARQRGMPTLLLADGHRLADHVDVVMAQFRLFLERIAA
ncbi:MAG TPA: alpha/beta hydrolase [Rhodanobacteraceae bacterium]|nr:alpha/beta hydrolase [Rhodanobacteraceae bacterium]